MMRFFRLGRKTSRGLEETERQAEKRETCFNAKTWLECFVRKLIFFQRHFEKLS